MSFSVAEFTGTIGKLGLASPNKFEVAIHFPSGLRNQDFDIMCETATIAGRSVQSMLDLQYGIRRDIAYGAPQYTPLSLTFLCTKDLNEKRLLDQWNNTIVNVSRGWDVAYYKDYIGSVVVSVFDRTGQNKIYEVKYFEAYPKTISQIDLSHGTTNNTLRVTAEFAYAWWENDESKKTVLPPGRP
jgi:hypothetical protein